MVDGVVAAHIKRLLCLFFKQKLDFPIPRETAIMPPEHFFGSQKAL